MFLSYTANKFKYILSPPPIVSPPMVSFCTVVSGFPLKNFEPPKIKQVVECWLLLPRLKIYHILKLGKEEAFTLVKI